MQPDCCEKPEKNSGLNGIWTHDLCDASAVLYQLSYQANWELVMFWVLSSSRVYYELRTWPAPSWLDSSVGRALHWHHRGHVFKSCSSLNFFQVFRNSLVAYITARTFSSNWYQLVWLILSAYSKYGPRPHKTLSPPLSSYLSQWNKKPFTYNYSYNWRGAWKKAEWILINC